MVDTIDDIDPPYRSGDSDKVSRAPKWPTVDEAKRRIDLLIDGSGPITISGVDLLVVMRELGRLTAENNELRAALAAEPASGEAYRSEDEADMFGPKWRPAPPPLPTQGEEETARDLSGVGCGCCEEEEEICRFFRDGYCQRQSDEIAAALRQRADEATRAFANWTDENGNEWVALTAKGHADLNADLMEARRAENEACALLIQDFLTGGTAAVAAAAIRARIAPEGGP